MSVYSGFFNSVDGDRVYDADDMGRMFDGLVTDGVYELVGEKFAVTANGSSGITVGSGRAWFRNKWIYNDSALPFTFGSTQPSTSETQIWDNLPPAHATLGRYDAVIISVGVADSLREVSIKIKSGIAGSNPVRPGMANTVNVLQKPIAYIYRPAGSSTVTSANVTNNVGTSTCPYAKFGSAVYLTTSEINSIIV